MTLYFVTANDSKFDELAQHFSGSGIAVAQKRHEIQEILHPDLDELVRQKTLSAYEHLMRPCAVEHGGLFIRALNDLPGGFTKEVWQRLGDRICELVPPDADRSAVARSVVGYCNGRHVERHAGETPGTIVRQPAGTGGYLWASIFVPEGTDKTIAQMSPEEKAEHSPVLRAWSKLRESLEATQPRRRAP